MKKRVFYISYDGMTDPLGQAQVLPYIINLARLGYQFTILSFEKKDRFLKEGDIIRSLIAGLDIEWVPLTFTSKPPIVSKIYDRWRLRQKAIKLQKENKFDLTHCRSYIAAEVGLLLKRKYGVKFLFDMRGFWADEKVDGGQWDQSKLIFRRIYKHYKNMEKDFLLEADAVVTLTRAAQVEIHKSPVYAGTKLDVIPCCADLVHFDYNRIKETVSLALRKELQISADSRVILYLGSVGGWYMTREMFSFFKILLTKYPEYTLLFLTKDPIETVRAELKEFGIDESRAVVRYSNREQLPSYLSIADCSIFFIKPTYSKIASSPTKHAELMGMGLPVICNDIGDTGQIVETTGTGIVIRTFNEAEYRKAIEQLPELLNIKKAEIRKAAFEYFDLMTGVKNYAEIYQRVLSN
jgi:glycosyltransferase involved in cell wall biosynthesis